MVKHKAQFNQVEVQKILDAHKAARQQTGQDCGYARKYLTHVVHPQGTEAARIPFGSTDPTALAKGVRVMPDARSANVWRNGLSSGPDQETTTLVLPAKGAIFTTSGSTLPFATAISGTRRAVLPTNQPVSGKFGDSFLRFLTVGDGIAIAAPVTVNGATSLEAMVFPIGASSNNFDISITAFTRMTGEAADDDYNIITTIYDQNLTVLATLTNPQDSATPFSVTSTSITGAGVSGAGANKATYMSVEVRCEDPGYLSGGISVSLGDGYIRESPYTLSRVEIEDFTVLDSSTYRLVAMSVLSSFTGSDLNNAGNIASSRADLNAFRSSNKGIYDFISSQQYNEHHGPIKEGAYTWWYPKSVTQLTKVRRSGDYQWDDNCILVNMVRQQEAKMQLTINQTIEHYDPRRVFNQAYPECIFNCAEAIAHAIALLPASTCNPNHKKVVEAARRIFTHENMEKLARGGTAAMKVAKDVARVAGPILSTAMKLAPAAVALL